MNGRGPKTAEEKLNAIATWTRDFIAKNTRDRRDTMPSCSLSSIGSAIPPQMFNKFDDGKLSDVLGSHEWFKVHPKGPQGIMSVSLTERGLASFSMGSRAGVRAARVDNTDSDSDQCPELVFSSDSDDDEPPIPSKYFQPASKTEDEPPPLIPRWQPKEAEKDVNAKEKEMKEKARREREQKEKEIREMKEKEREMRKEKEAREREQKEKAKRDREKKEQEEREKKQEQREQKLKEKEKQLRNKENQMREKEKEMKEKDTQIKDLENEVKEKEKEVEQAKKLNNDVHGRLGQMEKENGQLRKQMQRHKERIGMLEGDPELIAGMKAEQLFELHREMLRNAERIHETLFRSMQTDLADEKKKNECSVCMDRPVDTLCIPCKHLVLCAPCSKKIGLGHPCPSCREPLQEFQKVFK